MYLADLINIAKSKEIKRSQPRNFLGRAEFLELVKTAVLFDFGEGDLIYKYNPLTDQENAQFLSGQVPWPAPVCFYEKIGSNQQPYAYLVDTRQSDKIKAQWVFTPPKQPKLPHIGVWCTYEYKNGLYYQTNLLKNYATKQELFGQAEIAKDIIGNVIKLTFLMNSPNIIVSEPVEIVAPPMETPLAKELKQQQFAYRKVELRTIVIPTEKAISSEPVAHTPYDPDDAGYHVRYHWTRGHWRYLRDGRKIPVKGFWSGNIGLGEIKHDYDCTDIAAQPKSQRDLFTGKIPWVKPKVFQDLFA